MAAENKLLLVNFFSVTSSPETDDRTASKKQQLKPLKYLAQLVQ